MRRTDFQTVMHCWLPEAEAHAHFVYPGDEEPLDRIVPLDAEGSFIYLVIPVAPAQTMQPKRSSACSTTTKSSSSGGAASGRSAQQSLSEALHHPSSLREICLYRIGAFEQGLDLRQMEPEKAKKW